jgi:hypothetical protein
MLRIKNWIVALFIISAIFLTSCTSIPITNVPKLMALDPVTIDIGDVEMAVRLPRGFRIRPGGASLGLQIENETSGQKIGEKFILQQNAAPLTKFLSRKQKDGYSIYRFNMSEEAVTRATKLRAQSLEMREKFPGENSLSLSASAKFCLKPGANPFTDMRLTFFIRTNPDKKFYTLFKETKLPVTGSDGKITYCEEEAR